ncbi:helix-turn-helix transcriptional regulator [Azotobacter chroococcum]|uniref:XRE family transcriptional regulator n=1 Tax=Azotobacter chroococcum TaxID=353 RepID=UPI00103885BE|nr:helix-turn-helix transcriptional regulator [Azotobacter chroococcum]TBW37529.1 helix-turn-helix transcriptional regulator [Azotobacter chroococcum]
MDYLPLSELPTLADRINHAMQQRGLTQQQLGEAAGTSQTTIQKLCSGKTRETKKLNAIARALQVSANWLATGELPELGAEESTTGNKVHLEPLHPWDDGIPLDDDEVEIPLYKEVELAAGRGRTAVREVAGRKLRFSRATMRAAGVNPAQAVCATVSGNSMEPLIMNGATIGLDRGTTHVVDGEIYALEHDGMLRVKFLYRLPGGSIRLRSFNRDEHQDEDYSLQQQQDQHIRILGRVFWWSTVRPLKSAPLI